MRHFKFYVPMKSSNCGIVKSQFVEQSSHTTFGRFYPYLYTVWSLFRTKETSFVYQDMRGFLFV